MLTNQAPETDAKKPPTRKNVDDAAVQRALEAFVASRDPQLRAALARRFDRVVQWVANRFARAGTPTEDLVQMGRIGLLQALDRYDPQRGVHFLTYAISMIVGEIKHYFRDCTWGIKAPRHLQEIAVALPRLEERLSTELGRSPTLSELAQELGTTEEQIVSAMELSNLCQPWSLNAIHVSEDWESTEERQDFVGRRDPRLDAIVEFDALHHAIDELDSRKNMVIRRRFYEDYSQKEVARELGISQMHVSRLEREALSELRSALGSESELSLAAG